MSNYWDIIADGIYLVESNYNYNYWQSNKGPYYNFNYENAVMDNWVVLELGTDEGMLISGSINDVHVNFNRYTDGVNFYDLEDFMPDYVFDLSATSGTIDSTVNVIRGEGIAQYIAPDASNIHVKVSIEPGDEILKFDVMSTESLIYVCLNQSG